MRFVCVAFLSTLAVVPVRADNASIPVDCLCKASRPDGVEASEIRRGCGAWAEGRFRDARNAWVRARAWSDVSASADVSLSTDLESALKEADARAFPTAIPASVDSTPPPRRRRRAKQAETLTGRDILDQARAAREAGEDEKALRLFRIAAGMPGGESAAAEAETLERSRTEAASQPAR
jgi:hypothetical protein